MMYQNKIIKVFLREYYGRYSIIQREVGKLIKPSYGKECQLRKEYHELLSWYEIWRPEELDNEENRGVIRRVNTDLVQYQYIYSRQEIYSLC